MANRVNVLDILHQKAEMQRQRLEAWENLKSYAQEQKNPPEKKGGFLSGWKDALTGNPLANNMGLGDNPVTDYARDALNRLSLSGNAWAESVTDLVTDPFQGKGNLGENLRNVAQTGVTQGLTFATQGNLMGGEVVDPLIEKDRIRRLNEQYEARPFWQELGLGVVTDPTNLVPARGGANLGRTTVTLLGRKTMPQIADSLATTLPEFEDSVQQVVTRGAGGKLDRFTQAAVTNLGINRLPRADNPAEVAIVAFERQRLIGEEATNLAVQAMYDAHARRGTGGLEHIWKLDDKGFLQGFDYHWNDILERPGQFDSQLTPAQKAAFDDYRKYFKDIEEMLRFYEVPIPFKDFEEGVTYIRRLGREIQGIELRGQSNPKLQRLRKWATESVQRGVNFENNPRAVALLHGRWAYEQVAEKQLDDYMSAWAIPPSSLIPTLVKIAYADADRAVHQTESAIRNLSNKIKQTTKEEQIARARLKGTDQQRQFLEQSIAKYDALIEEVNASRRMRDDPFYQKAQSARTEVAQLERLRDTLTRSYTNNRIELARLKERFSNTAAYARHLEQEIDRLNDISAKLSPTMQGRLVKQPTARVAGTADPLEKIPQLEAAVAARQKIIDQWLAQNAASIKKAQEAERLAQNALQKRQGKLGEARQAGRESRRFNARANTATRRTNALRRLEDTLAVRKDTLIFLQRGLKEELPILRQKRYQADRALGRAKKRANNAQIATKVNYPKSVASLFGDNSPEKIPIGMWKGNYFPRDMADALNQGMERLRKEPMWLARQVEIAGNTTRMFSSLGDLAMPFVQGLVLFFNDPERWAKAAADSYAAWFDPTLQARLLRTNFKEYQRLVQMGVPVGDTEFFRASVPGQGVSLDALEKRLPKTQASWLNIGREKWHQAWSQTGGRFGASYAVGLASARRELVAGIGQSWKGSEAELGQYIRNMTGGLDSRSLNIGPDQRALESMWLAFSPRLLRSTTALVADALQGVVRNATLEGATAAQEAALTSLARFATGVTALYVHAGLAMNVDPEQIMEGLNPLNGKKFLSYNFNGDWIGVGGQLRALTQVMGAIGSTAMPGGKPIEDFLAINQQDNPLIGFWINRGAPAVSMAGAAIEATTGADALPYDRVDGVFDLAKHLGTSALPFVVQGMLEGEQLTTSGAAFFGARTSPQTFGEMRQGVIDEMAGQLGVPVGTPYGDIPSGQRDLLNADPRVARGMAEFPESQEIKSQLVRNAVTQWDTRKGQIEADLRQYIDAGLTGSALREKISDSKRDRYTTSQALFSGAVEEAMESGETAPLADQLAEFYWSAPLPENYATGELDFAARDAARADVLALAEELGLDTAYITQTGPGTYRGERFSDPTVKETVEELEAAQELLQEYWELPQKELFPDELRLFEEYQSLPANLQTEYARRYPHIRRILEIVERGREMLRWQNSEIDAALVKWYDRVSIMEQRR